MVRTTPNRVQWYVEDNRPNSRQLFAKIRTLQYPLSIPKK